MTLLRIAIDGPVSTTVEENESEGKGGYSPGCLWKTCLVFERLILIVRSMVLHYVSRLVT